MEETSLRLRKMASVLTGSAHSRCYLIKEMKRVPRELENEIGGVRGMLPTQLDSAAVDLIGVQAEIMKAVARRNRCDFVPLTHDTFKVHWYDSDADNMEAMIQSVESALAKICYYKRLSKSN